ncbi:MAG TPA: efflux RND transporter periplasmic adaptor subunit [Pseudomonadota bacterium]|nr:efflux RND transporter periplasmic adaptor subunit [Pseudomonadota bacterium]HNN50853.1 efflux RND transporter periplasmic adaptor subunit [Pseudomonadota bacterium]
MKRLCPSNLSPHSACWYSQVGIGLVFLLGLAQGCQKADPADTQIAAQPMLLRHADKLTVPESSPLRGRLKVEPVTARSVRRSLDAPAEVEADPARLARVTAPLPGRVVQLFVRFGDSVQKGQPLFELDSPDLAAAQTDYLRAKSALLQAERTLLRQQDLRTAGIGAAREVEQSQTDRDVAKSELERATLRLKLLGIDPGALGRPLAVRAPLSGRVVEYKVAPGEYRQDLADPLMTIADLSQVWVTASVQEKDIRRIQVGEDAVITLAAYPTDSWTGKVLFVGDLLRPETRTIPVRVAMANDERRLRPGMFGSVRFTENAAPELVVPPASIVLLGDASFVFVETAPFVFARRRVQAGAQIEGVTLISDGLKQGERIVVENAVLLQ